MKDQAPEGPPSADPDPVEPGSSAGAPAQDYGYGDTDPAPPASPAQPGLSDVTPALGQPTSPTVTRVARMRPVPEEFPTPPPRPTGWNRRRAPERQSEGRTTTRRPIIVVAVIAIIVLAALAVLGGGFLLFRVTAGEDPASGTSQPSGATQDEDPGSPDGGATALGEVLVSVASLEEGVAEVGPVSNRRPAQGEFVILTLDIENGSEQNLAVGDSVVLVADDGTNISSDQEATTQHLADSSPGFSFVGPGESTTVHIVFDVPPGTVLDHAEVDLDRYPGAGSGNLELG